MLASSAKYSSPNDSIEWVLPTCLAPRTISGLRRTESFQATSSEVIRRLMTLFTLFF